MFIMHRKMTVKEGFADQMVEQFNKPGIIEEQEGFIDIIAMTSKPRKGEETVIALVRWESEEKWKQWEKSDAHIAGHKAKRGQAKPDHIIDQKVTFYTVQAVKEARN
ncbi:antibiotic biosynthesis monooxygenase [Salinicoccus cyprini]|uniref:Signal transduction protein TRAP n=1 Tax=Salinicoccus cyprini TaxID=2493691 RepID=A0A558B055_9STAP|nr:antibiotic biosynthesis monooxygenase [Salinicoccus cyprini]TVT29866.1 antibiotic biosynthesis monooxygenase [Salinicoccus cyprini]